MKPIFTLILITCLPLAAQARLGETPEQCAERYGAVQSEQDGLFLHRKGDVLITLGYVDGVCGSLHIYDTKADDLPESAIQQLLAANALGKQWRKTSEREWVLGKNDGYATQFRSMMQFETAAWRNAAAKAKEQATLKALEGF